MTSEAIVRGKPILWENLWEHQRRAITAYGTVPRWNHLWDPRVGKTRVTLAQAADWYDSGLYRGLVVAPQTVCATTWEPEARAAFPHAEFASSVLVVPLYEGELRNRKATLRSLIYRKTGAFVQPTLVIVNRDALAPLLKELLEWAPEWVALDELHDYKTPSSVRHRAAGRICADAKYVRGLTGTPTPKGYDDLYGQYKIVDSTVFGTNQNVFRDRYVWSDLRFHNRVIGYKNVDELRTKMLSRADVLLRGDCFDVPKEQPVPRKVSLPPSVKKLYDEIAKKHVLAVDGKLLSLDHTLSRLTHLQRMAGGYLATGWDVEEDAPGGRWIHDAKIDVADDEVEDLVLAGKKVCIFHRFTAEGERLHEKLGGKSARVYGATKPAERKRLIEAFNSKGSDGDVTWPQVLILQESVGSVGISLIGADHIIFYSTGLGYGTHKQAYDRTFKPVTDDPGLTLVYIYLMARGTVDTWARANIKNKRNASDALLRGTSFQQAALGEKEEDD